MLLVEISSTEIPEHVHRELLIPGTVKLRGQIECRHGRKLERPLVDRALGEVAVEIVHRYGDDLPVIIQMIDDLVGPLADLGPPGFVDTTGGLGGVAGGTIGSGSDGVGQRKIGG